jgi:acetyl esterase/lipase
VVASVNYRLAGEARYPGAVQDVELSIQWLRKHAAEYHIDPKRVVLWGSSAGGHIASILGTGCGDIAQPSQKECVQGVIDWYSIIDLAANATQLGKASSLDASQTSKMESAYLGCDVRQCPQDLLRTANAMNFVDAKDPPFLIQHGAADVTVSPQQAQKLYDSLQVAGVQAEIVLYPGVSHGFARVPGGGPDDAINQQALQKVFEFLSHVAR